VRRTADVVIVGGGVTGASIAFHLAGRGVRNVLVLERNALASGATGRSVGIVRQLYPTPETTQMVVRSLAVFRAFDDAVGGDSGYVACGCLIGVAPSMRATLEASVGRQRALGVKAEVLSPDDVARVEPRIDPAGLGAVLWEPDSGYGDPTSVTLGFAEAARRRGVKIEQGVGVTAIQRGASRATGVETTRGERIDAPVVVNCAGLWAPEVARLAGVEVPIVVGRHPVFVVERDAGFGPPHRVYLDLAGGAYARPETGGLTLTGSLTDDETKHPMDPERLGAEVGHAEAEEALERTARAMPRLAEARYRRGWAGAFDITPDWMPILDETPLTGFWVAAGMSGHGFKLSPAVGEMMAARIVGATPPVSAAPFAFGRFTTTAPGATFVSSYLEEPSQGSPDPSCPPTPPLA
jgi:glycine/D-amino acid oxidase-like deaminating enzyme